MELDPFTKKLLERTKARREYLDMKEASMPLATQRKRRSPMAEIVNFSSSQEAEYFQEESPKRQCKDDTEYEAFSSEKENNTIAIQSESKNQAVSKTNTPQKSQESQVLKQESSNNGEEGKFVFSKLKKFVDSPNPKGDAAFSSQARSGCKKRLAALALQINQWEDDRSQFPSENCVSKLSTQPSKSLSNVTNPWPSANQTNKLPLKKEISVSNAIKGTADKLHADATSTHVSFSNSGQGKDKSPILEDGGEMGCPVPVVATTETKTSMKQAVSKHQQVRKVNVWDSAILATLECQGFTKSPSASKLQYEYDIKSKVLEEPKLDSIQEGTEYSSTMTDNTLTAAKRIKTVTFHESVTTVEPEDSRSKEVDPAELPLSARRALFEKAFFSGNAKSISSDKCETLSVAEKMALFEKASSGGNKQSRSTKFTSSFVQPKMKIETQDYRKEILSQGVNKQPASVPSVSMKGIERMVNMAALLNKWECASSAQPTTVPKELDDIPNEEICEESVAAANCLNKDEIEVESEIEERESNSDVTNDSYEEESENKEVEDVGSMQEARNITEQAVAVCDEIDELLDDALESDADSNCESITDDRDVMPVETKFLSEKETMKSTTQQVAKSPRNIVLPTTVFEGNLEVPLLHTVSVYRRQKQELQLTPIKKIVRREQIESPPSPDDGNIAVLQEKLRALQEEVLGQQTIISQASQALNLCHATTEFTGSTEQIEAERLLLVATQKRQAYLNEIHRLKTDRVLGNDKDGTGTLTLSDVCLGVKHEFLTAKSEGKLDSHVHYFICLVRYGAQLIATQMLSTEDGITANSLNFTNHITVQELRSDFNVSFEVYALQATKEVIPHNKKYHIKKDCSILRLTPKAKKSDSKLISPAISSPGGPNAIRTPSFGLVGFTRLNLRNVSRNSFILEKVPYISPLEGTLSMKVQLHAKHDVVERGFLTMFEDVSGFGAWHRRWCKLQGNYLAYWKYPNDDQKKDPIGTIDLRRCVTVCVKLVSRDICARPHTFQLVTVREQKKGDKDSLISHCKDTFITTKHLLSADTKEERILWCNRLNSALLSIRKWDPDAVQPNNGV